MLGPGYDGFIQRIAKLENALDDIYEMLEMVRTLHPSNANEIVVGARDIAFKILQDGRK